jgi:hypothetical protein
MLPQASICAATLGEGGVVGCCQGEEIHVPAFTVQVRDTTGAGDAFRAGFAARWLESGDADPDVRDLLEYAALVAGLSCMGLGAQSGLPPAAEVGPCTIEAGVTALVQAWSKGAGRACGAELERPRWPGPSPRDTRPLW